jgi:hypothetical protein
VEDKLKLNFLGLFCPKVLGRINQTRLVEKQMRNKKEVNTTKTTK